MIGSVITYRLWHAAMRLGPLSARPPFLCLIDEFHQSFVPGRSAELYDLYADAIGAIIGTAACCAWGIISRSPEQRQGASRHGL